MLRLAYKLVVWGEYDPNACVRTGKLRESGRTRVDAAMERRR